MGSVRKHQQIHKICFEKHFVVQRFILRVYNSHVLKIENAVFVNGKWVIIEMNMQHNFIPLIPIESIDIICTRKQ